MEATIATDTARLVNAKYNGLYFFKRWAIRGTKKHIRIITQAGMIQIFGHPSPV
tara:strand:- start:2988 stop:3149 length:162 start_codon:yes stop_codon:yes gene_type:complete